MKELLLWVLQAPFESVTKLASIDYKVAVRCKDSGMRERACILWFIAVIYIA